jgi:hypothetical protein
MKALLNGRSRALLLGLLLFVSLALTGYQGVVFPDGSAQTTASSPTWHQLLPPADRFVLVMGDEAVLDRETGLVWERTPTKPGRPSTWHYAKVGCYANTGSPAV